MSSILGLNCLKRLIFERFLLLACIDVPAHAGSYLTTDPVPILNVSEKTITAHSGHGNCVLSSSALIL